MQMHEVIKYKVRDEVEAIKPLLMEALREQVTQEVTQEVTEQVTEKITEQVTQQVTEQVTQQVTQQVTVDVEERMTRLTKILLDEGRFEDLRRVTEDKEYLKKLLAEYCGD